MSAALLLLALAVAPRSITNTEAVHGLAQQGARVLACTEGGVEVFAATGAWQRTLHVEDGLPAHGCRAARAVDGVVFIATDSGIAELDASLVVRPVSAARWQALPVAASRVELLARIGELERLLPDGPTWSAFSAHFAGTADGRIFRLGAGLVRAVPGVVLHLEERADELRIGTSEGLFVARAGQFLELDAPPGPLGWDEGRALARDGRVFRWAEQSVAAGAMLTAELVVAGRAPVRDGVDQLVVAGVPLAAEPTVAGSALARHGRALHLVATGVTLAAEPTAVLETGGVTWVGTRTDGVHRFVGSRGRRVTPTGQLCSNHVTAIARRGARTLVGTFDRGVCWEENGRWVRAHSPALPSDQVLGLAVDGAQVYVATTNGLGHFDGQRWTQLAFGGRNPIGLARLSVLAVQRSAEGVWVMDGRGASLISGAKSPALLERVSAPEAWAEHLSVVRRAGAFLWYASEDRGLVRFDGATWTRFHDGRDLTDNWVTAIDADAAGRLVAGTCQTGFNYFDGAGWTRVPSGLPSAMVTAVALTKGGAVIGTLGGAVWFDAASGALTRLGGLADPRVSSVLVTEDLLLVGTEAGLSVLPVTAG